MERTLNRGTVGVMTASLVIGSAIVMSVPDGPTLPILTTLGLAGYVLAFVNSVWIVYSIWRARRD